MNSQWKEASMPPDCLVADIKGRRAQRKSCSASVRRRIWISIQNCGSQQAKCKERGESMWWGARSPVSAGLRKVTFRPPTNGSVAVDFSCWQVSPSSPALSTLVPWQWWHHTMATSTFYHWPRQLPVQQHCTVALVLRCPGLSVPFACSWGKHNP